MLGMLLLLTSFEGSGAEPTPKPVLLHNLTAAEAAPKGPFGIAIQRLAPLFEMRSMPASPTGDVEIQRAKMIWLVLRGQPDDARAEPAGIAPTARHLLSYVENGGALLIMTQRGSGESGSRLAQALMTPLGVVQGNRRTGGKRLRIPEHHPLIGGLAWTTEGLTPLDMEESPALRNTVVLPNDLTQKTLQPQAPDYAGLAMIWGELGRGRIVLVADTDWIRQLAPDAKGGGPAATAANGMIFDRLVHWLTAPRRQETSP